MDLNISLTLMSLIILAAVFQRGYDLHVMRCLFPNTATYHQGAFLSYICMVFLTTLYSQSLVSYIGCCEFISLYLRGDFGHVNIKYVSKRNLNN